MTLAYSRLTAGLDDPATLLQLDLAAWTGVIATARRANVLARLAELAAAADILRRLPDGPASHLEAARLEADKHQRDILWELNYLSAAFAAFPRRPLLLKGCSYVATGVRARLGRLFGDFDILLPRDYLDDAEQLLMVHGWVSDKAEGYDTFFYRRWTHQLPPMRQLARQSTVDLHHTLRPPLGMEKVDTAPLFAQAVRTSFALDAPSPQCMVVHSAAHLFCGGEFRNGLRDLSDIDLLMREFGTDPAWWGDLLETGRALGLSKPLALAFVHGRRILRTPIPEKAYAQALAQGGRAERHPLDWLLERAMPPAAPRFSWGEAAARWGLYIRGYLHDMPPHILTLHLGHKLFKLAGSAFERTEREA